jgi:hypothetical protein
MLVNSYDFGGSFSTIDDVEKACDIANAYPLLHDEDKAAALMLNNLLHILENSSSRVGCAHDLHPDTIARRHLTHARLRGRVIPLTRIHRSKAEVLHPDQFNAKLPSKTSPVDTKIPSNNGTILSLILICSPIQLTRNNTIGFASK